MNIIGIDPSITSTAVTINGKLFNYTTYTNAYNKKSLKKWYGYFEKIITYRFIEYKEDEDYSTNDMMKIIQYNSVCEMIIKDINENIDKTKETKIKIEGYSYGSSVGYLVDLVTFSTILRTKLLLVTFDIEIVSPSSLKLLAAQLTYEPIIKGKKVTYKNRMGVTGGNFTKTEIHISLVENEKIEHEYVKILKELNSEIMEISKIPKPLEDVSDSFILYCSML
jgi:GTP:adenosylcobinamide-phosphate guanylyltransferase